MRLSFRQGIARYQTDVLASPSFLQNSSVGNYIDLIVSPDPTIVVFAHRKANYVVEEIKTVTHAWGPFSGTATVYLYWDINLLTGEVTRGTTLHPPMYSGTAPDSPVVDQHWFDSTETVMRVWNGAKWIEKIRVFAAYLSSGSIIRPYPLGSQAGITGVDGDFEGGNLVLDAYNKPLRQSDGTFVTSVTSLLIVNNAAKKVKFEAEVLSGMAAEPVPMYSLVQLRPGRRLVLARSTDYMSRIAGIVLEDLYTNEVGFITTEGLVRNEAWSFPSSSVNRPVFCGSNGELTVVPPTRGVLQVAGFVYDTDAVYMNIFPPIILDDLTQPVAPPVPPPPAPNLPIASFVASTLTGTAPLTVSFMNTSLNAPTSFEWDFTNDGTVDSTASTATYTYETPGTYAVSLKVSNGYGSSTDVQQNLITVEAPAGFTAVNLGVSLGAEVNQILRNQSFQASINVRNDGLTIATNVSRRLVIPDVSGQQVIISNLPPGTTSEHDNGRMIVTFPVVPTLGSGLAYGPVYFTVTAPGKSGKITLYAYTACDQDDPTLGDNSTSLQVQVIPA
jgi:PKD repeat protein